MEVGILKSYEREFKIGRDVEGSVQEMEVSNCSLVRAQYQDRGPTSCLEFWRLYSVVVITLGFDVSLTPFSIQVTQVRALVRPSYFAPLP